MFFLQHKNSGFEFINFGFSFTLCLIFCPPPINTFYISFSDYLIINIIYVDDVIRNENYIISLYMIFILLFYIIPRSSSPNFSKSSVVLFNCYLVSITSFDFLIFGLCMKSYIKSNGSAVNPSPPKITKMNHPTNESIPIT